MSDDRDDFEKARDAVNAARLRAYLANRACAGLTLPDDVPEGAMKRLVDAARAMARAERAYLPTAIRALNAALRELEIDA